MDPRSWRPPVAPLQDAQIFIGPNGDPWIANADTIRCVHQMADGSDQVIDRPHTIPWIAEDGVREAPQMVVDPFTGLMLVAEPGFITYRTHDQAIPTDTNHINGSDFQQFDRLDGRGRIWGGPKFRRDQRLDLKNDRREIIRLHGALPEDVKRTNAVRQTFEDRAGNLWFTTTGYGAFHTSLHRERFKPVDPGLVWGIYPGNLSGSILLGYMGRGPRIRYGKPGTFTKTTIPTEAA